VPLPGAGLSDPSDHLGAQALPVAELSPVCKFFRSFFLFLYDITAQRDDTAAHIASLHEILSADRS
jgi:hypothetical protein